MAASRQDPRIPVTLVTGFLGSGKTTLVNAVLRSPSFANALVIVNEFGETGLDHLLMEAGEDQVVLLDSGCLCCAATGSLRDTLIDLTLRRAAGSVPAFDRVIVETSGLANPGPLLATLVADSAVSRHFRLALVLTVVDGLLGADTLARHDEARRQAAVADRLLISKTDLISEEAAALFAAQLDADGYTAPKATWQRDTDPVHLFDEAALDAGIARSARAVPGTVPFGRGPFLSNEVHGPDFGRIRAEVLPVGMVSGWPAYAAWSAQVRLSFGRRLLRCKGVLRVGADAEPWVIQAVQGHFTAPARLGPQGLAALGGSGEDGTGFLVCIAEGVPRAELEATLALLETGPEPVPMKDSQ